MTCSTGYTSGRPRCADLPDPMMIHILESPSAEDLYAGRVEGSAISSHLLLSGIRPTYNIILNLGTLSKALQDIAAESAGKRVVVHLSCHGNTRGIQLAGANGAGDFVEWKDLRPLLKELSDRVGPFLLSMSVCEGAAASLVGMTFDEAEVPDVVVLGPKETVDWADSALAFSVFYRMLYRGPVTDEVLIRTMNNVMGRDCFELSHARDKHQWFMDWLSKLPPVPPVTPPAGPPPTALPPVPSFLTGSPPPQAFSGSPPHPLFGGGR